MCIVVIIVVVIILLIISSLLSTSNPIIVPETFNNINCYRSENQAITYNNNPLKFMKIGRYRIRGIGTRTNKFPNGLISIGTSICTQLDNNGRKITNNINHYDGRTKQFMHNAKNTIEYRIDPYGRLYTWRYTYVDGKLASTRNGVATSITPNRIIFDAQGSLFKTGEHHEDIKIILQKLSQNKYQVSLYVDDVNLVDDKTYTFIGK